MLFLLDLLCIELGLFLPLDVDTCVQQGMDCMKIACAAILLFVSLVISLVVETFFLHIVEQSFLRPFVASTFSFKDATSEACLFEA